MRDFLEDAEGAAARGEIGPGKANRGRDKPVFPKRFYDEVSIHELETGFAIKLDERSVKTPGKSDLVLPSRKAAELVASEWQSVSEEINPLKMPVTRLVNTAVDGVANELQAVLEDIVRYASSDLLCYRADGPDGLIAAQREHWDPILDWAEQDLGAHFLLSEGIVHIAQPKETLASFSSRLKQHEDAYKITCIHSFTSLSGSALIALALAEGEVSSEAAWAAAHVDEDWNISQWGEDHEAAMRRTQRKLDFDAAYHLFQAVS